MLGASKDDPLRLGDYLDRVLPFVDRTVDKLGEAKFRVDPIAGRKYSRATSVMSSAYKRHGNILGLSLLERLKDCARLRVWVEDDFKLSHESLRECRATDQVGPLLRRRLPYGDRERAIKIDILVYDERSSSLRSYNVKRGNGSYDGGKRRIIQQDLVRTHMHLEDYGSRIGLDVESVQAHIIFYYGLLSLPKPFSLSGDELDEHFDFKVQEAIETVNQYFSRQLLGIIEAA